MYTKYNYVDEHLASAQKLDVLIKKGVLFFRRVSPETLLKVYIKYKTLVHTDS